jgi:tetratricopeptide (TPR) repeat protein
MADPQAEARIRDLERRMAAMPGSRIFVGLAEEYRRAGRFGDALATLRTGLEAHPTYLSARIAIARLFHEMARDEEAIEAFAGVLAADRENLVAAKALGDLYARRGDPVEAVKKYKLYRALSGDRSIDDRVSALERESKPELPAAPPPAPAAAPAEARMFDPINFSDSSAEFRFDPAATMTLSTLEFSPEPSPAPVLDAPAASAPAAAPASSVSDSPAGGPGEGHRFGSIEDVTLPDLIVRGGEPAADPAPRSSPETLSGFAADETTTEPEAPIRPTMPAEEREAAQEPAPELPPSRTLAELYERQGFREEARRIYERLAEEHPEDESLTRRIAAVQGDAATTPPPSDPRSRRRRTLEDWLDRVKANAAAGSGS